MDESQFTVEAKEYIFSLDEDVLKIRSSTGTTRDEFDVTTIAHIQCITVQEDSRSLGIFSLLIGLFLAYIGYQTALNSLYSVLGFVMIVVGALLLFTRKNETKFQVTLQGIGTPFLYKISEPPDGINDLIDKINKKRAELRS